MHSVGIGTDKSAGWFLDVALACAARRRARSSVASAATGSHPYPKHLGPLVMSAAAAPDAWHGIGVARLLRNGNHGPLPRALRPRERAALIVEIEASGLTGRGGAAFPTARKLPPVARRTSPVVVANGTEGEPASSKDKVLSTSNPHLVVDGAVDGGEPRRRDGAIFTVGRAHGRVRTRLEQALSERQRRRARSLSRSCRTASSPARRARSSTGSTAGTRSRRSTAPFERGVGGRPTLVQNVETLANLGLIARYGADWFRVRGTADEPGTVLVTDARRRAQARRRRGRARNADPRRGPALRRTDRAARTRCSSAAISAPG